MKIFLFIILLIIPAFFSSAGAQDESMMRRALEEPIDNRPGEHEFVFIRGIYRNKLSTGRFDFGGGGRGGGRGGGKGNWWQTDFDDADRNFLRGIRRYTTLDTSSSAYKAMSLTDPELFEYPFLYINMKRIPLFAGNGPNLTPEEVAGLLEYMRRGGFVMIDDFWGPEHWREFQVEFRKIFPDRELVRLDTDHTIFHCFFDIDKITQVPGRGATWEFGWGFSLDDPEFPPAVYGVFDDNKRMMMLVNFNTDLGDGWEHTFDPVYPTRYCNEAYKLGINYIIYALSH
ncbi:MAG: DUF4159 domain-containing protein [Deltaproteobacteria bacterium]|nr:DUF4159 domain-containing protein [Deltaproteobacteria bacterium]